jgi:hypothetical protein
MEPNISKIDKFKVSGLIHLGCKLTPKRIINNKSEIAEQMNYYQC